MTFAAVARRRRIAGDGSGAGTERTDTGAAGTGVGACRGNAGLEDCRAGRTAGWHSGGGETDGKGYGGFADRTDRRRWRT